MEDNMKFCLVLIVIILFSIGGCTRNQKITSNLPKGIVNSFKNAKSFNDIIYCKDSIDLSDNDTLLINDVRSIFYSVDNMLVVADYKTGIYFFRNNKLTKIIRRYGSGPGEFKAISSLKQDKDGNYYLFDGSTLKIIIYNAKFEFVRGFFLRPGGLKKIVVNSFGNVYTLHEAALRQFSPAITKYDVNGKIEGEFGVIPKSAILQNFLMGGGICIDNEENIYYGFLSNHKIWKVDKNLEKQGVFDEKPVYFREAKDDEMDMGNQFKLINYSWKISRIDGIFYLLPGCIIQQISNGNPKNGEKITQYLEIWDLKGNKLNSKIVFPEIIIDSDRSSFFCIRMQQNESNDLILTKLLIYELKIRQDEKK